MALLRADGSPSPAPTPRAIPNVNQQANANQFAQVMSTAMAAAMTTAMASMNGMNNANQQYTTDLRNGQVVTTYPIPKTINWTATSAAGSGGRAQTMYVFNEDTFNASPTNNGSGAGSITTLYGDGFSGKQYNQLLKFPGDQVGKGIKFYGFNIVYTVATSGVQDPTGILNAKLNWLVSDGYGNFVPNIIDLSPGVNPGNYQDGLLRVEYEMYANDIGQFSLNLPVGDTVSLNFFTTPMQ